jgi:hypothetical protein
MKEKTQHSVLNGLSDSDLENVSGGVTMPKQEFNVPAKSELSGKILKNTEGFLFKCEERDMPFIGRSYYWCNGSDGMSKKIVCRYFDINQSGFKELIMRHAEAINTINNL